MTTIKGCLRYNKIRRIDREKKIKELEEELQELEPFLSYHYDYAMNLRKQILELKTTEYE